MIILLIMFVEEVGLFAQEEKLIGLIPVYKYDEGKKMIVSDFQQLVWQEILKGQIESKKVTFHLLEKEELISLEKLKSYKVIILPMMNVLSKKGLKNLKEYVHQGGKLIRDQSSVSCLDINDNGILDKEEFTEESTKFVSKFWQEVGGISDGSNYYNFVQSIRFTSAFPLLTEGLPKEYTVLDLPFKSPISPVYLTTFYVPSSAQIVAEAKILHIHSWNLNDVAKELEGNFPVITLNKYGKGYCLSLGLNLARVLYSDYPTEIYYTFFKNLIEWSLQKEIE